MPNVLASGGAQPQKPTRFTDLYTGRFFSGLFTNRSPLRDGTTDHLTERFYGQVGDTMIAGNNVEISNRLTLIRRPGNDTFDSNSYTAVNRFEEFRMFSPTTTHIKVMVDEAATLSALDGGVKTSIFTKASNAGQSHMQPVENSLYWGDGVSNKKWLETLNTWATLKTASTAGVSGGSLLGTTYPFMTTFVIDSNNNIQQLIAYGIQTVSNVAVSSNVVTFTVPAVTGVSVGQVIIPWLNTHNVLNGVPLKVLTASGTTVTASPTDFASGFSLADYGSAADTGALAYLEGVPSGSNLLLGGAQPTWSTTVPASGNNFAGGVTTDGNAIWINRGNYVQNWGISAPSVPTKVMQFGSDITNGASTTAWRPNTYYSPDGVLIDANGGIQLMTTAGTSGSSTPAWPAANAGVGTTTTDGTIVWTKIENASSTTWSSLHQYTGAGTPNFTPNQNSTAPYIIANNCLFKLIQGPGPFFTNGVNVQCEFWHNEKVTKNGVWTGVNGSLPAADSGPTTITSLLFAPTGTVSSDPYPLALFQSVLNGAGEVTNATNTPDAGALEYFGMSVFGSIHVPATALTLTFNVGHDDGMQFGFGAGTSLGGTPVLTKFVSNIGISNLNGCLSKTAVKGYSVIGGNNIEGNTFETYTITFPAEDDYPFEFNLACAAGEKQLAVDIGASCNIVPTPLTSNSVTPTWPAWSSLSLNAQGPVYGRKNVYDANLNVTTNAFCSYSSKCYQWVNLGPKSDFLWNANTTYNPIGSITDGNGNTQYPVRAGKSSGTAPTWATGQGQYTTDSNIKWLNQGLAGTTPSGTVSTYNGGWKYAVGLANSLDETVSNASPLSTATGNFVNSSGIQLGAGAGLPAAASIDSQCDQVCVYRTTDGQSIPLLIDGIENSFFTIPLCTYLNYGFTDSTPDTGLDANLEGPIAGECTAPLSGARCLAFHLNRIFFSVGNTVYWTGGPDAPIGNGTDGVPVTNFDVVPSLVTRLVPTATGVWVFTVSDIYFIPGTGQAGDPIRQAQLVEKGVGLLSYNALDVNGSIIGMYTSDNQFVLLQPGAGIVYVGHPIGDQFRAPNTVYGTPTNLAWNGANVYVAWHVNGEDAAWYVGDGTYGWYRMMATPAPERSMPCWSPFATIVGGVKAVQSIETAPGVHNLLLGPTGTGSILKRNIATNKDNGSTYSAFATVGSIVLAHPGQIAEVMFVTTDSVNAGTPLTIAMLIGEAIPTFTGPFEALTNWVSDPPNQPRSTSVLGQRFYLDELQQQAALMRHLQIQFNWISENAANELDAYTIWGTYSQES